MKSIAFIDVTPTVACFSKKTNVLKSYQLSYQPTYYFASKENV